MKMARVTGSGWGPFRGLAFSWALALCACPGTGTQDAGVDLAPPPPDLTGAGDLGDLAPPPRDQGATDLLDTDDGGSQVVDLAGPSDLPFPPVDLAGTSDLTSPPVDLAGTSDLPFPPVDLAGTSDLPFPPVDLAGTSDLTSPPADQGGADGALACGQQDQACCPGRQCAPGLVCGTSDLCELACDDGNPCTVDRYVAGGDGGSCEFVAAPLGTVCRATTGACDVVEVCDGASTVCPLDTRVSAGTVCRAAAGACDPQEVCDGVSPACPADTLASAGAVCRATTGACDRQEVCDGVSPACPSDVLVSQGTVCRAAATACDAQEVCNGVSPTCPADALASPGTVCRAAATACDAQEVCNGVSPTCPPDALASPGTLCRAAVGACDVAETCSGLSADCPTDRIAGAGVVCRTAAGICDAPEACDGLSTNCPTDQFQPSTTVCRASAAACDVAETCSGTAAACPADRVANAGVVCRTAVAACDAPETCDGASLNCPTDQLQPSGTVCRASAGICDVAETCSGTATACPTDRVANAGVACRATAGICDVAESCDGVSVNCPTDQFQPSSTVCRGGAGACDVAENCTGTAAACPTDRLTNAGVVCRASAAVCDAAEACDGLSPSCPTDRFQPSSTVCRASAGLCDVAESCTGAAATCPTDRVATAGVACRTAAGLCDAPESCDGSSTACPADQFQPSGTVCRASAGLCDVAETCSGTAVTCPSDLVAGAGVVCRTATAVCDVAESCNGVSSTCPADGFQPSAVLCRAAAGPCDVAENCSGTAAQCPSDGVAAAGTVCRTATELCDVTETCSGTSGQCPADATSGGCQVTVLAGRPGAYGYLDGIGATARFNQPTAAAFDGVNTLYIADSFSGFIRSVRVDTGQVSTLVTTGTFTFPTGLALDGTGGTGNLYVVDAAQSTVQRVTLATGQATPIAGTAFSYGAGDGVGTAARFDSPEEVTYDGVGNLYVADRANHTIRRIALGTGQVTTIAGGAGIAGSTDGVGTAARFNGPGGLVHDRSGSPGTLYVADTENQTLRRINLSTLQVTTVAGLAGSFGYADGSGSSARFYYPDSLAYAAGNILYVADRFGYTIRRVVVGATQATTTVTTLAGLGGAYGSRDGTGNGARFDSPEGLAYDATNQHLFVAENPSTVRRVVVGTGVVTTLAGSASTLGQSADGTGSAARFNLPQAVVSDGAGLLYVADRSSHIIRRVVLATGQVTTLAGSAFVSGSTDGSLAAARFNNPRGLVYDSANVLYVAEENNHTIRRIDLITNQVTTLAGLALVPGNANGTGTAARFNHPYGLALDGAGFLYVADQDNYTLRRIDLATGAVTSLAGLAGSSGTLDGTGTAARFDAPAGLVYVGPDLYVSEQYGNSIRRVTLAGQVTTIAGGAGSGANDGIGTAASFYLPRGLTYDGAGHLFIADTFNHTIRRLTLATAEVTTVLGNRLYSGIQVGPPAIVNQPAGLAFVAPDLIVITDDLENALVVANNP